MNYKLIFIDMVKDYALDIFKSETFLKEKEFHHHGKISTYEHSINVAYIALKIAIKLNIKVDYRSLLRGALLHDLYLYDWHKYEKRHRFHGFKHARFAYINASKEFNLNKIEKDIILKHMFPLNIIPPLFKESYIVTLADKISTLLESMKIFKLNYDQIALSLKLKFSTK